MDLIKNQEKLQEEAREVLKELHFEEMASKYGEIRFAGSFETGLLVWRDIDCEVWVEEIDREKIADFVKEIINATSKRVDINIIDNRDQKNPHHPNGIYVGIKFCLNSNYLGSWAESEEVWKMDCWFIKKEDSNTLGYTESVKSKLTDEKKKIILEIKNQVWKDPSYKKKVFSVDIYNGVLDNNVTDMESFREYLKTLGKEI